MIGTQTHQRVLLDYVRALTGYAREVSAKDVPYSASCSCSSVMANRRSINVSNNWCIPPVHEATRARANGAWGAANVAAQPALCRRSTPPTLRVAVTDHLPIQ